MSYNKIDEINANVNRSTCKLEGGVSHFLHLYFRQDIYDKNESRLSSRTVCYHSFQNMLSCHHLFNA